MVSGRRLVCDDCPHLLPTPIDQAWSKVQWQVRKRSFYPVQPWPQPSKSPGNMSVWAGHERWWWPLLSLKLKPMWMGKCVLSGIMEQALALMQSAEVMTLIPTGAWWELRRLCIVNPASQSERYPSLLDYFGCTGLALHAVQQWGLRDLVRYEGEVSSWQ